MIRVTTDLQDNGIVTTLIDEQSAREMQFWSEIETLELMAQDLLRACALARQKMGLGGSLILPPGARKPN